MNFLKTLFLFLTTCSCTDFPIEYCSFDHGTTIDIYKNESIVETLTIEPNVICSRIQPDFPINDYLDLSCSLPESPSAITEVYLGIAIGSHLFETVNNSVINTLRYIDEYIHQANIIYINQFKIKLIIRHVMISIDEYTSWDNFRCRNSIYRQFAYFQRFPKSEQFFWHLIDACYQDNSAIGVATVGSAGSCQGNAPGITHISKDNPRVFLTTVHELGHNLGALHHYDVPGIMGGYKVSKIYLDKYQFHNHSKENICETLNYILQTCPNNKIVQQSTSICGNGVIELNEECECPQPLKKCNCCDTCRLKPGAECDPVNPIRGVCCDNNCQLKDYTQECYVLGHLGYCRNGYCTVLNKGCQTQQGGNLTCKIKCNS